MFSKTKNIFMMFYVLIASSVMAFDFTGIEQQVECPITPPQVTTGNLVTALQRAPCEIFPLERFNIGSPDDMEGRCRRFSESIQVNCSNTNNIRSERGNQDCLADYYNGSRDGDLISYNEDDVYRSHVDRTDQLYRAYVSMIDTQAEFASNQNIYGITRLDRFVNDETNPVKEFSCRSFTRTELRSDLLKCSNDQTTLRLHRMLDAVESSGPRNRFEEQVRDIYQIAMENIEGGVRQENINLDNVEINALVRDVSILQANFISRMFYLTSEEMVDPNANQSMLLLNFRKDYGDNVDQMKADVKEIMDKRYEQLAENIEVGAMSRTFSDEGFPSREDFDRRRDEYLEDLSKRYRLLMVLSDVVESAVVPTQMSSIDGSINATNALREQIQKSATEHNLDTRDFVNTGWFDLDNNNELDFNEEFFDFLKAEIRKASQSGKLDGLKSINGAAGIWFRFQHAQLSTLQNSCDAFHNEVENLCNSIEENQVVMTASAAEACYQKKDNFSTKSRVEFAHHICAGENGYHLNGEIPVSAVAYFHTPPEETEKRDESVVNYEAGDPRSIGGGSAPTAPSDLGSTESGSAGRTTGSSLNTPTALGSYWEEGSRDRSAGIISTRNVIARNSGLNRPLTDIVAASQATTPTPSRSSGLFGNLFDNNGASSSESMWDYLTRSVGGEEDKIDFGLANDAVEEGLLEGEEVLGEEELEAKGLDNQDSEDPANQILERIGDLEQQLETGRNNNDPRVEELMTQIREQQAELARLREEREQARVGQQRRSDTPVAARSNVSPPARNRAILPRRRSATVSSTKNKNQNRFDAQASAERNIASIGSGSSRVVRSASRPAAYQESNNGLSSASFENISGPASGIRLTVREVAEVGANEIPRERIITSLSDPKYVNLLPDQVVYLEVDNGVFIKHERNEDGELTTQEVRVKGQYAHLPESSKIEVFPKNTASMDRVIVRLKAIEEEAGVK